MKIISSVVSRARDRARGRSGAVASGRPAPACGSSRAAPAIGRISSMPRARDPARPWLCVCLHPPPCPPRGPGRRRACADDARARERHGRELVDYENVLRHAQRRSQFVGHAARRASAPSDARGRADLGKGARAARRKRRRRLRRRLVDVQRRSRGEPLRRYRIAAVKSKSSITADAHLAAPALADRAAVGGRAARQRRCAVRAEEEVAEEAGRGR